VIHAGLPYRITLAIGILILPLAGCDRGDTRAEVDALRQQVARLEQTQAAMLKSIAALEEGGRAAPGQPSAPAGAAQGDEQGDVHDIPVRFSPRKGTGAVTVVEFADFQCPFCQASAGISDALLTEFPNDVQFAFKHYPLERHPDAMGAAKAAWAAHQQGKFWEMHDLIYGGDISSISAESLRSYAQQIGLDMARFDADMASRKADQAIMYDKQLGRTIKLSGTPSFFVNGRRVTDRSQGAIRTVVLEEIAKNKEAAAP
jgi:protein-disulfide isomerase